MDELTSTFVNESRDQLQAMEDGLLRLEQAPDDGENIGAIFRAAHTIKGGSGVVECAFIESFTHKVENVLDLVRNGEIPVSGELASVMLACCDHLGQLLDTLAAGQAAPDAELQARGEALQAELSQRFLGRVSGADSDPAGAGNPSSQSSHATGTAAGAPPGCRPLVEHEDTVTSSGGGQVGSDSWHVSVRFGPHVLRQGMDPLTFLRYLGGLGEILALETIPDGLPDAADMDPESCYLGFEIHLQSRAGKSDIERVFEFCRDDITLNILPPKSKVSEYLALINELPEDPLRLGEMLVRVGALTRAELDEGLQQQSDGTLIDDAGGTQPLAPLGDILVGQKSVQKEVVEAAASKQAAISEKKALEARMIRVHADKLDQLIDLVGELVIAGASANLLAQRSGKSELHEATSILSRLVESIRDSALQLRMVPIGETFNRFHRVVRDAARDLGKELELTIDGGDTELDKSVVEKLGDPLMHLIRNAIDHGIEAPALRASRNKDAKGHIGLNAYHDSGSIVIEVSDDGGGLPKDKIRRKAIDKGLIADDAQLSEQEILNLIFEPGFSTAEQVTNISGRGVGMDVVRRNIQSLRGSVEVLTEEGQGSVFTIRLPLTLAIIDGFLTGVGKAAYVVPLDSVVECIELQHLDADRNYLNLRGEVLPFVRLREMFEVEEAAPARQNVVIVQYAGQKAGLVVDALLGEFQTVIKPLGVIFKHLRGIGGSTILGSGEVALILDVPALIQLVTQVEGRRVGSSVAPALLLANER